MSEPTDSPPGRLVTEDESGIRLDRWLRRHHPGLTQGRIEKFCRTGKIRVDGKRATAATRLQPGQSVRTPHIPSPDQPETAPPPDPAWRAELEPLILYQDAALMVLDKPAGLPVQGGPGITRHLDRMLEALAIDGVRPRLVHRLDRDTSGVLLLARTPGVAAALAAGFRDRLISKTYWALVAGQPRQAQGRIELKLRRRFGMGVRTEVAADDDPTAAPAITEYQTLGRAEGVAWLALSPLSGRTHQLRVHCAAIGTPILGDALYGAGAIVPGLSGQLQLHARMLSFPHPHGGRLEVAAPPPAHLRAGLAQLGFAIPATPLPRWL